ncbi:YifB family Mg chelatase-like AAA ATPase [Neobacillus ginsengisoli]|uniref:Magnesium chelatase family protein n=1 Tax=Neobacillus ginsengisoli TaxID=904295 RepID=A0ABT9XU79_9BACI|nr:YifB family Mg chelatase-like AAA ATPase [Neobacillus ginsengisoli]MDQ0199100.1 magnesium chelatase family protein [Neobacillus ginsengisoli]
MWAKVTSIGLKGMEGYRVNVEVGSYVGADSFKIVGLPDAAVKESKERIIAALQSLGYTLSGQKIIINLSPAEQKKSGPMFDFPMAISVLLSLHELEVAISDGTGFIGALSLDGSIQPVAGMLPAVLAAKKLGLHKLFMPFDEKLPVLEFDELDVVYVSSLGEVIHHLSGETAAPFFQKTSPKDNSDFDPYLDFQQVIGHGFAKNALEVPAAGEHHVLMTGPPGCGKSLLAESFPSILPSLTKEAQLEMISLYQLSGNTIPYTKKPPFRNPHHSASGVSIIGGGQYPKPGEISLSHRGVLFLDEIGEFSKKTLDMLRQPLENGYVTISRTHASISYPASFILIAAMNPCPCGYSGSNSHYCTCTAKQILSYQNKLSGPLRDRFDINLLMKKVDLTKIKAGNGESSKEVRKRVEEARNRQYDRYGKEICNSRVGYDVLIRTSPLSEGQKRTLHQLSMKKNWSNRTQIKIIRLSRTISDLQAHRDITDGSIREAVKLNGG